VLFSLWALRAVSLRPLRLNQQQPKPKRTQRKYNAENTEISQFVLLINMGKNIYQYTNAFPLESGGSLPSLDIAYHTYGELNKKKSNVIWICHALTASSDAADWWSGLVGDGKSFYTKKYLIVCAHILGACYGSYLTLSHTPVC